MLPHVPSTDRARQGSLCLGNQTHPPTTTRPCFSAFPHPLSQRLLHSSFATCLTLPREYTMTTQPCRFFLAGTCRNGSQCRFFHEGFSSISRATLLEAEGEPDTSEASSSSSSSSSSPSPQAPSSARPLTRTHPAPGGTRPTFAERTPCRWYLAGYCCRGEACWFSHDRVVIGTALGSEHQSRDGEDNEGVYPNTTENANVSATPALEEDDMKCAICFEIPSTFGLLGERNPHLCPCTRGWHSRSCYEGHIFLPGRFYSFLMWTLSLDSFL